MKNKPYISRLSYWQYVVFPFNFRWHLTPWNECSKTCGKGDHFRVLYCRKQINESYFQKVDDKACYSSTKPNVTLFQQCNEVMCPPEWRPLPWSEVTFFKPQNHFANNGLLKLYLKCLWQDIFFCRFLCIKCVQNQNFSKVMHNPFFVFKHANFPSKISALSRANLTSMT